MSGSSYDQKLIALSLLKVTNIEGAKRAFAEYIQSSCTEAVRQLLQIQRNDVLLNGNDGIISMREGRVWLYQLDRREQEIDEHYLSTQCHSSKRARLEKAMQFLKERKL